MRHLVIVMPGGRYGPSGAALRIPCLVLEGLGAQTAAIKYPPGAARAQAAMLARFAGAG